MTVVGQCDGSLTGAVVDDLIGALPVELDGGEPLEVEVLQLVLRAVHLGHRHRIALLVFLSQLVPDRQDRLAVA